MINLSKISFFILLSLLTTNIFCQDYIYLISGEEIKAKITEVKDTYIFYKIFDDMSGKINTLNQTDVLMIKYNDGTIVVMANKTAKRDTAMLELSDEEIRNRAITDANTYYKTTEPVIAAVCTSLACPVVGLIPAMLIAMAEPKLSNYKMPEEYKNNGTYIKYYGDEAIRIKQKRVALASIIATTPYIIAILITLNM